VLALDEDMASLGSRGLFALRYPTHPLTAEMQGITDRIVSDFETDEG
jgi:hypothetical protein